MATRARRAACHDCGKKQPAEKMVYSRYTHRHYCIDFKACERRAKRKARAAT